MRRHQDAEKKGQHQSRLTSTKKKIIFIVLSLLICLGVLSRYLWKKKQDNIWCFLKTKQNVDRWKKWKINQTNKK